jgi:hypothetical protein
MHVSEICRGTWRRCLSGLCTQVRISRVIGIVHVMCSVSGCKDGSGICTLQQSMPLGSHEAGQLQLGGMQLEP